MAIRSERFEMRLDEEIITRVDQWRSMQQEIPSRSEAMRRLVELGLEKTHQTVSFSDGEKLLITMMGDIYKQLNLDHGEIDPKFITDVISGGHYWAPKWEMKNLFHGHEDDPREVRDVVDILDMWNFVEAAYEVLSESDKEHIRQEGERFTGAVKFIGFDGNNEASCLSIARFLIKKMGKFSRFKERCLNSHCPTLISYKKMMTVFEPMREKLIGIELSADQIISILKVT